MINIVKIEDNTVFLEHGCIELCVEVGGWSSNYDVKTYCYLQYERPNIEVWCYEDFSTLQEAFDWYENKTKSLLGA